MRTSLRLDTPNEVHLVEVQLPGVQLVEVLPVEVLLVVVQPEVGAKVLQLVEENSELAVR